MTLGGGTGWTLHADPATNCLQKTKDSTYLVSVVPPARE